MLLAITVVHLGLGDSVVGIADIFSVLTGSGTEHAEAIFLGARLPRTLAGLVAGTALGVAGALIQGVTRNPLASPDTLGINAGAYLAVVAVAFAGLDLGVCCRLCRLHGHTLRIPESFNFIPGGGLHTCGHHQQNDRQ